MSQSSDCLIEKLDRFARIGFTHLPTPFEPMQRITEYIGGPRIWVKREDCTGFGFGGNKLRKLDYVLAQALETGADTIISGGVVQSNSQRQVAAAAAKIAMDCHLAVFHGRVKPPDDEYELSGNALLNLLFGATLHHVPWTGDREQALVDLSAKLKGKGRKPFIVPYGVSNELGAVGYASAAAEIAVQSHALGFMPDAIVHCSGSGATQAGLAVGAHISMPGTQVVGIDIDAEPDRVLSDVQKYAAGAARLLEAEFDETRIEVIAGMAGPAYGIPHQATIDALKLAARLEALVLDPVYSAKGFAGLLELISTGRWDKRHNVVFVHTGGEPALFAYRQSLQVD